MKRLHELTKEQQIFAEKNHALVECFLRKNHLERSEFYDVVVFGYLGAVQEYLERSELVRYPFSSIAWANMKECMQKEFIYQNRPKRKADVGVYHEDFASGLQDRQAFSQMNQVLENIDHRQYVQRLVSQMTSKEKEVVYMRAAGYSYREIAEVCNITIRGVSARLERMRRRFQSLALA